MKIPKRFKLFGETIEVVMEPELADAHECWGYADYDNCAIFLQPKTKKYPRTPEQIERVFWHEVMHFIFLYIGEGHKGGNLREDETIVDLTARLVHQTIQTAEYK